jgi:protein-S-isoprenylcysteine O-methyltransferase Ste14
MKGLVLIFFVWCCLAVPIGCAFAYVEGRVNGKAPRWLNCILFSVFLGFIGWIVIAMRSGLSYASKQRENQTVVAEAAKVTLRQHQDGQQPPVVRQPPVI